MSAFFGLSGQGKQPAISASTLSTDRLSDFGNKFTLTDFQVVAQSKFHYDCTQKPIACSESFRKYFRK